MLISLDSKTSTSLHLGVQTNPELFDAVVIWKIQRWAPSRAASYKLLWVRHTDYHGHRVDTPTGYGEFEVEYYTRLDEGIPLPEPHPHPTRKTDG